MFSRTNNGPALCKKGCRLLLAITRQGFREAQGPQVMRLTRCRAGLVIQLRLTSDFNTEVGKTDQDAKTKYCSIFSGNECEHGRVQAGTSAPQWMCGRDQRRCSALYKRPGWPQTPAEKFPQASDLELAACVTLEHPSDTLCLPSQDKILRDLKGSSSAHLKCLGGRGERVVSSRSA